MPHSGIYEYFLVRNHMGKFNVKIKIITVEFTLCIQ